MTGAICTQVGAAKLALLSFEQSGRVARDDWSTGARVTTAAKYNRYSEAAKSAVSYDRTGVTERAG